LAGTLRPLTLDIQDEGDESESPMTVIKLDRPYACQGICCPCCLQKMSVSFPPGNNIGSIVEKWGLRPQLHIKDEKDSLLFIIKCPFTCACFCCNVDFPVKLNCNLFLFQFSEAIKQQ